jgi:hypothetical protein
MPSHNATLKPLWRAVGRSHSYEPSPFASYVRTRFFVGTFSLLFGLKPRFGTLSILFGTTVLFLRPSCITSISAASDDLPQFWSLTQSKAEL